MKLNKLMLFLVLIFLSINLIGCSSSSDDKANQDLSENLRNEIAAANNCNCSETRVSGDKESDGNSENSVFYYGYEFRMMVDESVGQSEWYNIDRLVGQVGALTVESNQDGSVTAVGKCFISPNSGKCYKFMGFREKRSANSLINQSVYKFTSSEGTQRAYWATFQPK